MQKLGSRKKNLRFISGFTLVELLIVISIMVLLFSFGYANYREFQRRQHLESAVRMIKADLRLAQEMALAGRKPSGCEVLHGYMFQVYPDPGDEQYDIGAYCDSNETCENTPSHCVKRREQLPEGVDIGGIGWSNRFYFNVLGRGIDKTTSVTILLSHPSVDDPVRITVTPAGEIK